MKILLDNSTNSYYNRVRIRIKGRWDIVEDPYEAVRRLIIAINKIDGSYYFYARKLGVKENTLALLYELDDGHPHSQKQISEDWQIPKTTINTIVKQLVQRRRQHTDCARNRCNKKQLQRRCFCKQGFGIHIKTVPSFHSF